MLNKWCFLGFLLAIYSLNTAFTQVFYLSSPDVNIQGQVIVGERIEFSVYYKGKDILEESLFALKFDQVPLFGKDVSAFDVKKTDILDTWWSICRLD